ncbi:MAG: FAD-dependent oxidoreductase [Actinomycetota bacterium]|nr:FAD-dependent oxidoreductase [Actinomycetota bacterium]
MEAQDRPGGRVQTVREPFVNGGYAEAGALRITDVHVHTNKYIDELGLRKKIFEYRSQGESCGISMASGSQRRRTARTGHW